MDTHPDWTAKRVDMANPGPLSDAFEGYPEAMTYDSFGADFPAK